MTSAGCVCTVFTKLHVNGHDVRLVFVDNISLIWPARAASASATGAASAGVGNSSAAGAGAGSGYGQTAYGTAGANATAADGAGNYAFAKGTGALEAEGYPGVQRRTCTCVTASGAPG